MGVLGESELQDQLQSLDGWSVVDGKLHREVELANFSEAFGFMTRVALVAEKLDHHPDWSNSWNKVVIDVVSHADGGITGQCVEFATRVNKLLA